MEIWLQALYIVGGGVVALGGREVFALIVNRYFAKKDEVQHRTIERDGKEIDADQNAFVIVTDRLKIVEKRVDDIQEKLSQEMAKSAGLTVENEALKRENERQAKKLHDFAEKLSHKDAEILQLTNEMHKMALEITQLKTLLGVTQGK